MSAKNCKKDWPGTDNSYKTLMSSNDNSNSYYAFISIKKISDLTYTIAPFRNVSI